MSDFLVEHSSLSNDNLVGIQPQLIDFSRTGSNPYNLGPHASGQLESMYSDAPAGPCNQHALAWLYTCEHQRVISRANGTRSNGGSIEGNFIGNMRKAEFIDDAVFGVASVQAFSVEDPLRAENFPSTQAVPASVAGHALCGGNPVSKPEFRQARTSAGNSAGYFMSYHRPQDAIDLAASSHDVLAANTAGFYFYEDLAPPWDRDISSTYLEYVTGTKCFEREGKHSLRDHLTIHCLAWP